MKFETVPEYQDTCNRLLKKRSPYLLRSARLHRRRAIAKSIKKSNLKGRITKTVRIAKKASTKAVYADKRPAKFEPDLALVIRNEAKQVQIEPVHDLDQMYGLAGTEFEFPQLGNGNWCYHNCEGECDASESTYHSSEFKPTPALPEPAQNQHSEQSVVAGYFLRSSVAMHARKVSEIDCLTTDKKSKIKLALTTPHDLLTVNMALDGKKKKQILSSDQVKGANSATLSSKERSDVKSALQCGTKKKTELPPATTKVFKDEAKNDCHLDITSLKVIPHADVALQSRTEQKPTSWSFLMIREKEFPNLFDDPVSKHQKMSKYFDEQDFNSDCETIDRNKTDLLEHLAQSVTRFVKTDPTKFVENLKNTAPHIQANDLVKAVDQVKPERALKLMQESSSTETKTGSESMHLRENKNKQSKKQVQLVIETPSLASAVQTYSDAVMESPRKQANLSDESPACVDEESIAFGVMYYPRARPQRTDKFNCDTRDARLAREVEEEFEHSFNFTLVPTQDLGLGFVSDNEKSGSNP